MIANVIPIITMTMANPITAVKNGATISHAIVNNFIIWPLHCGILSPIPLEMGKKRAMIPMLTIGGTNALDEVPRVYQTWFAGRIFLSHVSYGYYKVSKFTSTTKVTKRRRRAAERKKKDFQLIPDYRSDIVSLELYSLLVLFTVNNINSIS
jgi:hypothetical protein